MNLTTKKECIAELIRITKLQTKALGEDNIEEFASLLDQRGDILSVMKGLPQHLVLLPTEEEVEERKMVEKLIEIDNANKERLDKEMESVKGELRRIRYNRKTQEHYTNPYDTSQEEGVFFDKRERR